MIKLSKRFKIVGRKINTEDDKFYFSSLTHLRGDAFIFLEKLKITSVFPENVFGYSLTEIVGKDVSIF